MTLNPAHILEVAFLLLAAFLAGAIIGSLARVLVLRVSPGEPVKAVAALVPTRAAIAESQPALVGTPVIEPVARPAQPAAPAEVPVPDFAEVIALTTSAVEASVSAAQPPQLELVPPVAARPEAAMAPARSAGQTTSGLLVPSPRIVEQAKAQVEVDGPGADVIPFPTDRGADVADVEPLSETLPEPEEKAPAAEQVPEVPASEPPAVDDAPEGKTAIFVQVAEAAASEPAAEAAVPEPPTGATVPDEPVQVPMAPFVDDEAAAMRAIEGGWAPKRNAARRATKAPKPEGIAEDEPASGQRPDPVDETPGRPAGVEGPRNGTKDNLTNIIGVLPVLETALNQAGIYHFDQIAGFSDENVAWLEGHLGIVGRIDREHWREQARELAIVSERARKVAGK